MKKNIGAKKNLINQVNNDINKKNNNFKTPSKLKLSINDDDFHLMEKKNSNELKILNLKKDNKIVDNKMYKTNDKAMYKKNANKKKNCK